AETGYAMGGLIRIAPYLAGLALLLAALWWAYTKGIEKCQADHNAELLERIEEGQRLEAERHEIAQERDNLARQLEEQANADPVFVEQCLSPDRVRRLNAYR
ncbi:MAG: hypothetical protein AAGC96_18205, partial [Pseudomonadota bacterium]